MNTMPHPEIIGLDVSRDWLDIHCLSDGRQLRLPNTDEGHSELESIAGDRNALVCFEAAGGCEWRPDFDSLTRFLLRSGLARRCMQGDSGRVPLRAES